MSFGIVTIAVLIGVLAAFLPAIIASRKDSRDVEP